MSRPLRWRADQRIVQSMGAKPEAAPAQLDTAVREVSSIVQRLYQDTGHWPAMLVFTSLAVARLAWSCRTSFRVLSRRYVWRVALLAAVAGVVA